MFRRSNEEHNVSNSDGNTTPTLHYYLQNQRFRELESQQTRMIFWMEFICENNKNKVLFLANCPIPELQRTYRRTTSANLLRTAGEWLNLCFVTLFVLHECAVTLGRSLKAFHRSDTQLGTMAERRGRMETRGKTILPDPEWIYSRHFFSKAELVWSDFSFTAHRYVTKYTLYILETSMVIEYMFKCTTVPASFQQSNKSIKTYLTFCFVILTKATLKVSSL